MSNWNYVLGTREPNGGDNVLDNEIANIVTVSPFC